MEQIEIETGYKSYIIRSAFDALREQGMTVQGHDLNEYNPAAVDADTADRAGTDTTG